MTAQYDDTVVHDAADGHVYKTLNSGDTYYLAPSGSIAMTGASTTAISSYPGVTATLAGTLYATSVTFDAATATSITVTKSGQVLSTGNKAIDSYYLSGTARGFYLTNAGLVSGHNASVFVQDDVIAVTNSGSIVMDAASMTGKAIELAYVHDGLAANPSITVQNTGLIQGITAGIYALSGALGAQIYNSGTIIATAGPSITADGPTSIVNDGTLVGDVLLYGGNDSVDSSHGWVHGTIYGGGGDDVLIGSQTYATVLDGGAGADALTGGSGIDTAAYYDAAGSVTANLTDVTLNAGDAAGDSYASIENLTGGNYDDILVGDAGANTLQGGLGADTMQGGAGNDTYYVDNPGDLVFENPNEGTDLVHSTVSYTLGANVERLTLDGTAAINGTGNELANVLIGNGAANILDGKGGADFMAGGAGNDIYYVDNPGDMISETGPATDTADEVRSTISWTLGPIWSG